MGVLISGTSSGHHPHPEVPEPRQVVDSGMLGPMRLPFGPLSLLLGVLIPALGACPGDDSSSDPTSAGPPSSTGNDPTTSGPTPPTMADSSTTAAPPTMDPSSTGLDPNTGTTMATTTDDGPPQVTMETNLGTIVIELDEQAAPITVGNFLAYVDAGFYDGTDGAGATIFHRVVAGFVIQGGGFTEALDQKPTMAPIVNESGNGLSNVRGTIAMARTNDPDSATAQFYFNLVDNTPLDDPPGYAVFGQIVEGLEVMDAIGAVAVGGQDIPVDPVIILSTTVQ